MEVVAVQISLQNNEDYEMSVAIEPWATEFILSPGATASLIVSSTSEGYPYIALGRDLTSVYLWTGCTCRVEIDGVPMNFPGLLVPHP